MRIFIYGECDVYGSGAWCYRESLIEMGFDTSFFSPTSNLERYATTFFLKAARKLRNGLPLKKDYLRHAQFFFDSCKKYDPHIVIILKGLLLGKEIIEEFKSLGYWVVLINHDDFFSAFKTSTSKILFKALPSYNYIFCTKEINVSEIKIYNPNVEFFMFAYYPKVHRPPEYSAIDENIWNADVVFVGNSYKRRIRQLEYLVKHSPNSIKLKIFGPNWEKNLSPLSPLKKYIQNKVLDPKDMAKAIYYSKVSLGFLCEENRDDYTQRTFEIPACKGIFLAERTIRHLHFLKEGEEAFFFDTENLEELVEKVSFLLRNENQRMNAKEQGYQKITTSHHTYKDRLDRIIELYKAEKPLEA